MSSWEAVSAERILQYLLRLCVKAYFQWIFYKNIFKKARNNQSFFVDSSNFGDG